MAGLGGYKMITILIVIILCEQAKCAPSKNTIEKI